MPDRVKPFLSKTGAGKYPNRLKEIRESKGMSQEKLAALINVIQSTLSRYESGKRRMTISTLDRLSNVLGCHWAEFYSPVDIPRDAREAKLLADFRRLPPDVQDLVERMVDASLSRRHQSAAD